MHGFEVRFWGHHYELTSCLAHAQCATIWMNMVYPINNNITQYQICSLSADLLKVQRITEIIHINQAIWSTSSMSESVQVICIRDFHRRHTHGDGKKYFLVHIMITSLKNGNSGWHIRKIHTWVTVNLSIKAYHDYSLLTLITSKHGPKQQVFCFRNIYIYLYGWTTSNFNGGPHIEVPHSGTKHLIPASAWSDYLESMRPKVVWDFMTHPYYVSWGKTWLKS